MCGRLTKLLNQYKLQFNRHAEFRADVFSDVLNDISRLIESVDPHDVVVGGDFNTDFSRNSAHTTLLKAACVNEQLFNVSTHHSAHIDYTYCNYSTGVTSSIDHFLVSERVYNLALNVQVAHSGANLSDHEPLILQLRLPHQKLKDRALNSSANVQWHRATDSDFIAYRMEVENNLRRINGLKCIQCANVFCTDHYSDINNFCTHITKSFMDATERTIPCSKPNKGTHKIIPGWDDHVEPYRKTSMFWHRLWLDNGRPSQGIVADTMRRTRCEYHTQVRWAKQNARFIQSQKVARSVLGGDRRDFWAEVKKIRGCKSSIAASIDHVDDDNAIANIFADKYSKLYNSVPYDSDEMCTIRQRLTMDIVNEDKTIRITGDEVRVALRYLKPGKSDGKYGLMSDHLINDGHCTNVYLCMSFNCMIMHGVSASSLRTATLVPIPKDKRKCMSSSDNYRAIALSSPICKLLDVIIINKYGDLLGTCEMQCGFKENGSTNMCTAAPS